MKKTLAPSYTQLIGFVSILLFTTIGLSWLTFLGCQSPPKSISPKIIDVSPSAQKFPKANQLKYAQAYDRAVSAYSSALKRSDLTTLDSLYLLNQMTYCRLIINNMVAVDTNLTLAKKIVANLPNPPKALIAGHLFNQGRYHFLQRELAIALPYAHGALQNFYQSYPQGHLKIAQGLTLLSLIHLKDGNLTDSIHYYSLQANNVFLKNPILKKYDWENDYLLGYSSLLQRSHEVGEYYCLATLQKIKNLPFENLWLEARTSNLLANLLKKQSDELIGDDPTLLKTRKIKLYESADSLFLKAIAIGKNTADNGLMDFYMDWIINVCRFDDATFFFQAMDTAQEQFLDNVQWLPHHNRLLGYYYSEIESETAQTIQYYSDFVKTSHLNPHIDYRVFGDGYFVLRTWHRQLRNFDLSAKYAKKSLFLYDCITEEIDILSPDAVLKLDSTKRYCLTISSFIAEDLLDKFFVTQNKADLALANTYFEFVKKNSFKSLLSKDEDAFLTFQLEMGGIIYEGAIKAASEAWKMTNDLRWLDQIFNYMEYLKSYLLYRDMLKSEVSETEEYSLTDSIRILQGEVNQLLYALSKGETLSNNDLSNNNLVNQLKELENRRSNRLHTFEAKIINESLKVREIQRQLTEKHGLVSYINGPAELFGLYIDKDTVVFFQQVQNYEKVKKALTQFRQSICEETKLDKATFSQYLSAGKDLYQVLVEPFSSRLSKIEQLIVIPDQLLGDIPFEALLTESVNPDDFNFRELPYLLHQTKIVYTSSWKIFNSNKQRKETNLKNKSIGFWTIPALATTNGLEVIEQSVKSNFKDKYQVFNEKKGGKKSFSTQHSQFDILHLLLHASSSRDNRYDNKVSFGNTPNEVLYGFDLYKEKFNSKLLVLASCESAVGARIRGEGTFSLARSFINSGVPEVLAAQFLIPQTTTAPLLSNFYQNLNNEHNVVTALHLAKIDYIKNSTKARYAYPRFWAGMVLFN